MLVNSNDDIKTIVAFSSGVISSILYHVSIYTLFVKTAQGGRWHSHRSGVLHIALNTPRWQLLEPKAWGKRGMEPNLMGCQSINPIPFSPIHLPFLCLLICCSIAQTDNLLSVMTIMNTAWIWTNNIESNMTSSICALVSTFHSSWFPIIYFTL